MNTTKGREYWQSFQHLADSEEVQAKLDQEFSGYDPNELISTPRRNFLKLLGASMALAGITLTGCRRWPKEKILAYTTPPAGHIPGVSEFYASQLELSGVATGVLVQSYNFRPIKIEGNPGHPFSRSADPKIGAATSFMQNATLEFYDPERSREIVDRRGVNPIGADSARLNAWIANHFAGVRAQNGAGFAVLSEATSSPTIARMRAELARTYPQSTWFTWEPVNRDNEIAGLTQSLGRAARPVLHLDKADIVVSIDDDILGKHPAVLRYSADWALQRRRADSGSLNRVYCVESTFSNTGAVADVRVPARTSEVESFAFALAAKLGVAGVSAGNVPASIATAVDRAASDIQAHRGSAVVTAGAHLSPAVHAVVARINAAIGAIGTTIRYVELPAELASNNLADITAAAEGIRSGAITTLVLIGGNPVYDAPADLKFADLLKQVPNSLHLSLYDDETSALTKWHVPRAHPLESWGDGRAWDGTISHQQPLIQPLYNGRTPAELLAVILGQAENTGDAIVRRTFQPILGATGFEAAYRKLTHDGVLPDTGFANLPANVTGNAPAAPAALTGEFEVRFIASSQSYDGRFANSGWLIEMPDPMTRLTWDNAALISIADAEALRVTTEDMVRITVGERSIDIPVYVVPGQPKGVIELPLGWARQLAGVVGDNLGFDTYALRTTANLAVAAASVEKIRGTYRLASTVEHHLVDDTGMYGREKRVGKKGESGKIIKDAALATYIADKKFVHAGKHGNLRLQVFDPPFADRWNAKADALRAAGHPDPRPAFNDPHAWGMAIDMNACTGCGACVTACQAENNIPFVGKTHVLRNREMHWIRIDRYFKGKGETLRDRMHDPNPQVVFQPMLCVHCENAPCEQVCPVAATVHDTEGLNTMVYNRCIGTRYCSNNCPYKVRRFNYLDYHSQSPRHVYPRPWLNMPDTEQVESIDKIKQMLFNPDVTVRMRGVMEKCTFCTQRIKQVTIKARSEGKDVPDGAILTACQQTCPTQAIVFGDLNDPLAQVTQLHRNPRSYEVLEDLNTRPRGKHMAKIRNGIEA